MADLSALLAEQLVAPPAGRMSTAELVAYTGTREGATRALSGLDGPPGPRRQWTGTPAEYDAQLRAWRSAARSVQRATTEKAGAQTRGRLAPNPRTADEAVRTRARGFATSWRLAAFRRSGMSARMVAVVRVSKDVKLKRMPAGGPAVNIGKGSAREILDRVRDEGIDAGAAAFATAFMKGYRLPGGQVVVDEVVSLKVWPATWPEPAPEG